MEVGDSVIVSQVLINGEALMCPLPGVILQLRSADALIKTDFGTAWFPLFVIKTVHSIQS